jgi:hypothetical protein
MRWTLHWLEAEGDLGPWRDTIAAEITATEAIVARLVPPPRLDILVQRVAGGGIPEIGMVGHAWRKALFGLTLDPDNPAFAPGLGDGTLRRQVAHEVHHCLRMGACGYGRTLGEALVSEGLAGHFVGTLFGSAPEPWERAVDDETLRANLPDEAALAQSDYAHAAWFFGRGGRHPRWLGYTLGYRIVGEWRAATPEVSGDSWIGVGADVVLAAARRGILSGALNGYAGSPPAPQRC